LRNCVKVKKVWDSALAVEIDNVWERVLKVETVQESVPKVEKVS